MNNLLCIIQNLNLSAENMDSFYEILSSLHNIKSYKAFNRDMISLQYKNLEFHDNNIKKLMNEHSEIIFDKTTKKKVKNELVKIQYVIADIMSTLTLK